MTKTVGTPKSTEQTGTPGTFYGHPIVLRVKDLSWQPPVEEQPAASKDWVSNLLGEDPVQSTMEESLLVNVPTPEHPQPSVAPVVSPPQPTVPEPEPEGEEAPSYIHHRPGDDSRQRRESSLPIQQWKNRLVLPGIAISLVIATCWIMFSGEESKPPVEDVPQGLFVTSGELGSAPAWDATAPPPPPSETITIEPLESEIPYMASAPRNDMTNPSMSNPSTQAELTNVAAPQANQTQQPGEPYIPMFNQDLPPEPMAPEDEYYQFRPEGMENEPQPASDPSYAPSFNPAPSAGTYTPQFDGGASSSQIPNQQPSMQLNAPEMSQNANPATGQHWMQQQGNYDYVDGKLIPRTTSGVAASNQSQMPQIVHGSQSQPDMPAISTPQQPTYSQTNTQEQSPYGYGPYSNQEAPQEGARLGSVQPLDLGVR
ncbi:hypothetical protein GC197_07560 [bacterium]|nr:hypothetical protein [bacterium]